MTANFNSPVTLRHPVYAPCRQNTPDARGSSALRCSSPGWPWHSLHISARTCRSSPSGSRPFRPSRENLRRHGTDDEKILDSESRRLTETCRYLRNQRRIHTGRRRSVPGARSCPAPSQLSAETHLEVVDCDTRRQTRTCSQTCVTHVQYGSIAVVAPRGEQMVVICLTVRFSVPLKEVPRTDLLLTVRAHKVLWVPRAAHGRHHLLKKTRNVSRTSRECRRVPSAWRGPHLSYDGLTAGAAHSFGHRLDTQFVQVRLKAAQHVVQFVDLCRRPPRNTNLTLSHYLK